MAKIADFEKKMKENHYKVIQAQTKSSLAEKEYERERNDY